MQGGADVFLPCIQPLIFAAIMDRKLIIRRNYQNFGSCAWFFWLFVNFIFFYQALKALQLVDHLIDLNIARDKKRKNAENIYKNQLKRQ